jgi:hypothetical protein
MKMTTTISEFRREQQISSVRLCSGSNIAGTYNNGPSNNGVGATLTIAASTLTIDSVACANGDRVLLLVQTATYEQGIYEVSGIGSAVVLTRSSDFQVFDQMVPGYYVPVSAGTTYGGACFTVVEPQVQRVGVDAIVFTDNSANPTSVTLTNLGLKILNPAGTFTTTIDPTTAITANRLFNLTLPNADTTLTMTGSATLNQDVSTTGSPSFGGTTASATPGTLRSVVGAMAGTNATMTSGNLVGVRGAVTLVGASGGFLYGTQGKVIASGTLSGSSWTAGVFGQLDISAATVNAGQTAAIWGDYGTTSGTMTDTTGMRGVAMTNTTAAVLNAQDYRYGNATYLLELAGAGGTLNYYIAAGTSAGSAGDSTKCAAQQVIRIVINGTAAYIPVFTQNT